MTFGAAPGAGTTAAGTAALRVASVNITNRGSGYTTAPTVTFGAAPSGGTTATGAARLAGSESGYDQYQNLYWARQTLEGKQLLVRLAD